MPKRYFALTPEQQQQAADLYEGGWSCQQVADRFGCHKSTVQDTLRRLGVKQRNSRDGILSAKHSSFREYMANRPVRRAAPSPLAQAISTWRS